MSEPKLLVTEECGRLARWLRLMGYDTQTLSAQPLPALYQRAVNEQRAVVTRNRRVRPGRLVRVVQVRSQQLPDQLRQLITELGLGVEEEYLFSRCDVCNREVEPVEKAAVKELVPPYVFQTQSAFHRCPSCRRIYWAATHAERARAFFSSLRR
jgi:uncharacterized protein with PIN domain